jgi:hypothetical protein
LPANALKIVIAVGVYTTPQSITPSLQGLVVFDAHAEFFHEFLAEILRQLISCTRHHLVARHVA